MGVWIKSNIIAFSKFVWNRIIVPFVKGLYKFILVPISKGIKFISKLIYNWLIFPACKYIGYYLIWRGFVYWFIWRIILHGIIWHTLYYSWIGSLKICAWIGNVLRILYRSILRPIGEIITYGTMTILRPIGRAIVLSAFVVRYGIVSVSRSIENTVRSILRTSRPRHI